MPSDGERSSTAAAGTAAAPLSVASTTEAARVVVDPNGYADMADSDAGEDARCGDSSIPSPVGAAVMHEDPAAGCGAEEGSSAEDGLLTAVVYEDQTHHPSFMYEAVPFGADGTGDADDDAATTHPSDDLSDGEDSVSAAAAAASAAPVDHSPDTFQTFGPDTTSVAAAPVGGSLKYGAAPPPSSSSSSSRGTAAQRQRLTTVQLARRSTAPDYPPGTPAGTTPPFVVLPATTSSHAAAEKKKRAAAAAAGGGGSGGGWNSKPPVQGATPQKMAVPPPQQQQQQQQQPAAKSRPAKGGGARWFSCFTGQREKQTGGRGGDATASGQQQQARAPASATSREPAPVTTNPIDSIREGRAASSDAPARANVPRKKKKLCCL